MHSLFLNLKEEIYEKQYVSKEYQWGVDYQDARCVRFKEYGLFYKVTGDSILIIYYLFNIDFKDNRIFIPKSKIDYIIKHRY